MATSRLPAPAPQRPTQKGGRPPGEVIRITTPTRLQHNAGLPPIWLRPRPRFEVWRPLSRPHPPRLRDSWRRVSCSRPLCFRELAASAGSLVRARRPCHPTFHLESSPCLNRGALCVDTSQIATQISKSKNSWKYKLDAPKPLSIFCREKKEL